MFQETIKNFHINLNDSNQRICFSSGDLITGQICFDLTKETKITSITMQLTGKAQVHWSTGRKRKHRRNYSSKLDFFNLKSVIMQENNAVGVTPKLPPGAHVYPFTCQLPRGDFPSSFKGAHGQILYTMTADIYRPWHMVKTFMKELNFVNRIDTNPPELHAPLSGSNIMTLCCLWGASGPITMTTSIEKKAFVPGETVKIICKFSNASSRTATPKVTLQQKQAFFTHNKVSQKTVFNYPVSVTGRPVVAHTSDVRTEIMVTIPSSASFTISNCSILDVSYLIEVSLSIRAFHDLTVLFPIILCDTPVDAQPPPYEFQM